MEKPSTFSGAKLLLFIGPSLVVLRRDDIPGIPYPDHWDLPGGGRDGCETPEACVIRETREEVGIRMPPKALTWSRAYRCSGDVSWMFAAHLPTGRASDLRLGDEGQAVGLMSPSEYAAHPKAIRHFVARLNDYLSVRGAFS